MDSTGCCLSLVDLPTAAALSCKQRYKSAKMLRFYCYYCTRIYFNNLIFYRLHNSLCILPSSDQAVAISALGWKGLATPVKIILPSEIRKPVKLLEFMTRNDRYTYFLNLFIVLTIFVANPVTVASGETSFSKLKLLWVLWNLQQMRRNSLAVMFVDFELAETWTKSWWALLTLKHQK